MSVTNNDDRMPLRDVPVSVFCPGRNQRRRRCRSFKPTVETQKAIERERRSVKREADR